MDTANIASLLHEFQRSLSLFVDDQDAPMPLESSTYILSPTPRSTDPRVCPRPPTPPPSRRPPNHTHHLQRPTPNERSDTAKRVQPDSTRSRRCRRRDELDESTPGVNQRARFITPDSDEEIERAWRCHPDTARRTSGPLRSILRNKHAGTPYQRLPVRHAVRWAVAP